MSTQTSPPYPCPCCGYLTFSEPPPATYLVCPICFWEDRGEVMGLRLAQRNFLEFRACDREWRSQVRPPTGQDRRVPNWQTLDALAEAAQPAVIEQITRAFAEVTRDEGVTLHEAAENEYWGGPFHPYLEARQQDTDTHWQEIPEEWIETLCMGLHYLDPKGWRYYIPAFMLYALRHYMTSKANAVDWTIYQFTVSEDEALRDHQFSYFEWLTDEQSRAVCQFLRFMAHFGDIYADGQAAQKALDMYWGSFCAG